MKEKITLKELSVAAGISIATASRARKDPYSVKESTRLKLQSAMQAIEKKKTGTIAVVIPDIANQFFPLLLTGIEEIARIRGFSLMLCNSQGTIENEDRILLNLIRLGVDGIIFICSSKPSKLLQDIVASKTIPLVFLDRDPGFPKESVVMADNHGGMVQSAKYLSSLGHRHILYLRGKSGTSTDECRHAGFFEAMEEEGVDPSGIQEVCADYRLQDAYLSVSSLLEKKNPSFTAICASNDVMAYGAYKAVRNAGLSIPEDVSLIGFDDLPTSDLLDLTTIRQPFPEMGRTAMVQLLGLISSPELGGTVSTLPCALVIRHSCRTV